MKSNTTQPPIGDPTQGWGLQEWRTVLHNAAQVPEGHPRYQEAQQFKDQALDNINSLMQQGNAADQQQVGQLMSSPGLAALAQTIPGLQLLPPAAQEQALAGTVGFGRGASLGLVSPNSPLGGFFQPGVHQGDNPIGEAHPKASAIGDVLGTGAIAALATPLTAGLSPWLAGATIGGVTGAARGFNDPALTGDRKIDAALGGLAGVLVGPVVGKASSLAANAISTVGRNIARVFAQRAITAAAQSGTKLTGAEAVDATEAVLRQFLATKNVPASEIDAAIARSRPLWEKSVPRPALAANVSPIVPKPAPEPIPGTEGRGFSVSGTRATPTVQPNQPTLAQMTGMANLQQPVNAASVMRSNAQAVGRELSQEEKDMVLQRILKQRGMLPKRGSGEPMFQQSPKDAARNAYNAVPEGAGQVDPRMSARNAAGRTMGQHDWDPRYGLGLLLSLFASQRKPQ